MTGNTHHDMRGWTVESRVDDQKVGSVHDVLADDTGRARYYDVELDGGKHVLLAAGETNVDEIRNRVVVRGLGRTAFSALPAYRHGSDTLDDDYARRHASAYDRAWSDRHYYDRADYRAGWVRDTGREETGEVARLDELDDVKVASHDPDPRGWDVVGANGRRIGKVDHLIGDTGAMKVRYLAVDLDDEVAKDDRQVLLPAGHVDLDTAGRRVVARGIERERIADIPPYRGTIDRDYETDLRTRWSSAYSGERRWEHPRYRSSNFNTEGYNG